MIDKRLLIVLAPAFASARGGAANVERSGCGRRRSFHPLALLLFIIAGCGGIRQEPLPEPPIVTAHVVAASTNPLQLRFVPPSSLVQLYTGCYKLRLPPSARRPSGWPQTISFALRDRWAEGSMMSPEVDSALPLEAQALLVSRRCIYR